MNHSDHVRLLRDGIAQPGGLWADFGSGAGAFTLALAELLGPSAVIHSVDRDAGALARQRKSMTHHYPEVSLQTYQADFTRPVDLPPLDGLVIANALHFLPQKEAAVNLLRNYLRPGGRFLVIEYDTDRGNHWVPFPFSYERWRELAAGCQLQQTRLLATARSSFLGRFYSALSYAPALNQGAQDAG